MQLLFGAKEVGDESLAALDSEQVLLRREEVEDLVVDDVADFPVLRGLPVHVLLRLARLLSQFLLLAQEFVRQAEISPAQESPLSLRVMTITIFAFAAVRPILVVAGGLQEIAQEHLIQVLVVVDVGVCRLVEVLGTAAQDAKGLALLPGLVDEARSTLFRLHERSHLLDNRRVEHR